MSKFKSFRAAALGGIMLMASASYQTASAGIPTVDVSQALESVQNVLRYKEQFDKMQAQLDQAESLYNKLNSVKFTNLLSFDASGTVARTRLQSIYDGANEDFGLGLPDLPTEGMLRYYGSNGFMDPTKQYPINLSARKIAESKSEVQYLLDGDVNMTKKYIEDKNAELALKMKNLKKAEDMKANLELNNSLVYQNGLIMLEMMKQQNHLTAVEVVKLQEKTYENQKRRRLWGDFSVADE